MTAPTISATAGGAHRIDEAAVTTEHSTPASTATASAAAASTGPALQEETGGVPVLKVVLFLAGCVLLVLAAANLSNLGQWSDRWGVMPVFLAFFLVMSIAGRWFWTGADAILGTLLWGKNK